MYKLFYAVDSKCGTEIKHIEMLSTGTHIPYATGNTDYQTFKAQINADEAQLEDVNGNLMTPEEAKAYVATLP